MGWRVGGRAAAGARARGSLHRRAVFVADGGGAAPSGSIDARGAGGAARGLLLLVLQLVGDPKAQGHSTGSMEAASWHFRCGAGANPPVPGQLPPHVGLDEYCGLVWGRIGLPGVVDREDVRSVTVLGSSREGRILGSHPAPLTWKASPGGA